MSSTVQASVRRLLPLWAVPMLAAAFISAPALAVDQAATTSEANTLEEIVVTAQFRQQNVQDTPLAVTAVNAATMEARDQTSLHDVAQQAPNVELVETGGAFGP